VRPNAVEPGRQGRLACHPSADARASVFRRDRAVWAAR
jgi:hypothetical protein